MRKFAALGALLAASAASLALAADDFPIAGTYVQNRPCHADGTDAKPLMVSIHEDQIEYRGGTCVMSNQHLDGNKLSTHVTCKSKSGSILSGDISFTLRDDGNLEMIDQDRNYKVVLNRCPKPPPSLNPADLH